MEHGFLLNLLIFLTAAVVFVPISQRLGFGSVLGYLVAGLLIGPAGAGWITNVEDILHFSEFGVVLLLFIIGLELEPKRLWAMRVPILGMGGVQVGGVALVFSCLGMALGLHWTTALIIGLAFSLSSTAIALQILGERKLLATTGGRGAFSILLFQDIAVIPIMALVPLLAVWGGQMGASGGADGHAPAHGLGPVQTIAILIGVIIAIKLVLRKTLQLVASLHLREVFTALSLLLVGGMAALMQYLGLSMGLGAFAAGILLADSEYRHAVETDIEPFKGLLLGLFFISVGMSVDVKGIMTSPGVVAGLVAAIVFGKIGAHFLIARIFRVPRPERPLFAIVLAQVGEFAFVVFGVAKVAGLIADDLYGLLIGATAASMLATPLAIKVFDQLAPYFDVKPTEDVISENEDNPVIIAGFGRVGQIVGRLLFANGISATVLDYEPDQIEMLRRFGFKVYYGDATRIDLLEAAGAHKAKILVVAIDDVDTNTKLVALAQQHFPHLEIIARVRNVGHYFDLKEKGVLKVERESFDSSLRLGRRVLEEMGWLPYQAQSAAQRFRMHDLQLLEDLYAAGRDDAARISRAKQARQDLLNMFTVEDAKRRMTEEGWNPYDLPVEALLKAESEREV